jgi:phosphoglycolate phosphatase-like HAD superfamily hydrolase
LRIKAVVFDLDGTIVSFNIDYVTVRAEVRSLLIGQGLPASILQVNESIFDMLGKAEIFLRNSGKSERTVKEVRGKALAVAERYELEAARSTVLLPEAVGTLEDMRRMNLKVGLCTVNSKSATSYVLKRFGITECFDAVVPREAVRCVKPSGEHLEATLKALGVRAGEAVLVGDGARDMQCANELKVIAVGLPTGVSSKGELTAYGANYLISSLAELPKLVERIEKMLEDRDSGE